MPRVSHPHSFRGSWHNENVALASSLSPRLECERARAGCQRRPSGAGDASSACNRVVLVRRSVSQVA